MLLALAALLSQTAAQDLLRRDLGDGFAVEAVEKGVLLADDSDEDARAPLRAEIRRVAAAVRARAFDPAPANALSIVAFRTRERLDVHARQKLGAPLGGPVVYDAAQRRLTGTIEHVLQYAPQVLVTFFLAEHVGNPSLPPWIPTALGALVERPEEPPALVDHRAAVLREAHRRKWLPGLRAFLPMDPVAFSNRRRHSIHTSLALHFAQWLDERRVLRPFFEEWRRGFRQDRAGLRALEAALGRPAAQVEVEFLDWALARPWIDRTRFEAKARGMFGPRTAVRLDDELVVAASGDVDAAHLDEALDHVRVLRGPLMKRLGLEPTGLPVFAQVFASKPAYQDHSGLDARGRALMGGYYLPDTRAITVFLPRGSRALTHEYVHSMVEDTLGALPPWLCEGLSELFVEYRLDPTGLVPLPDDSMRELEPEVRAGRTPKLAEFVEFQGAQFWVEGKASGHYALARAFCFYLFQKGALEKLVAALKQARARSPLGFARKPCRDAVEAALGQKVEAIDADFRSWIAAAISSR